MALSQDDLSREIAPGAALSFDDEGRVSDTRRFEVAAYSPLDALGYVFGRWGIRRGVIHQTSYGEVPDLRSRCLTQSVETKLPANDEGGLGSYIVSFTFGIRDGGTEPEADPDAPASYDYDSALTSGPIDLDRNGEPITNSAGAVLDPPITDAEGTLTLRIVNYYASFSPRLLVKFRNGISSRDWTPKDPDGEGATLRAGEVRVKRMRRRRVQEGLVRVEMLLDIRENDTVPGVEHEGHDKVVQERGIGPEGVPVLLDAVGYVVGTPNAGEAAKKVVQVGKLVDLNELGV
ncbi:MAG: hypothetical protein AAGI68_12175 [Planctomycetota bacterium]